MYLEQNITLKEYNWYNIILYSRCLNNIRMQLSYVFTRPFLGFTSLACQAVRLCVNSNILSLGPGEMFLHGAH